MEGDLATCYILGVNRGRPPWKFDVCLLKVIDIVRGLGCSNQLAKWVPRSYESLVEDFMPH